MKDLFRVCVCVFAFVRDKDLSQLHTRALANWEGRICFDFDWVVWESFPLSCPLDFGCVKLNCLRQGNIL